MLCTSGMRRTLDIGSVRPGRSLRLARLLPVALVCSVSACSSGGSGTATTQSAPTSAADSTVAGASSTSAVPATVTTAAASTAAPASTAASTAATAAPAAASSESGLTAMVVDSTAEQYFVLYVKPDLDSTAEIAVAIRVVRRARRR